MVLEKLSIERIAPPSGPFVAWSEPRSWSFCSHRGHSSRLGERELQLKRKVEPTAGSSKHPDGSHFPTGTASLFGFTAIALGLVGYVPALFKLSPILIIVWAWLF